MAADTEDCIITPMVTRAAPTPMAAAQNRIVYCPVLVALVVVLV